MTTKKKTKKKTRKLTKDALWGKNKAKPVKGIGSGRPSSYTKEVYEQALDYLENYEKTYKHAIPSVVGLCKAINRGRQTMYVWCKDGSKPEFTDLFEALNELQQLVLLNKGLEGTFNAGIVKLVLGKHGFHEKQEIEHLGLTINMPKADVDTL